MILWHIIFWGCILLILHSYLLFPWLLQLFAGNHTLNTQKYAEEEMPSVAILMSVYNEASILEEKLDSLVNASYAEGRKTIMVGSDDSDDGTNEILLRYQDHYPFFHAFIYDQRQGKPAVINAMAAEAREEILLLTDAKVIFHRDTVTGLVRHFRDPRTGIVGGNILNESISRDGVSIQEKAFMSREILMKYREGLIWKSTIGVYGAVYALRKSLFTPVPEGFSVDDFFITLEVIRKGYGSILDIDVITYENVPNLLSEEYRRKVRIATGNFQNLGHFLPMVLTPWKGSSFAFISHKVIRWTGPFLFILLVLSNIFLYNHGEFYRYSLYALAATVLIPFIDYFLSKIGIHIVFLRFVRHFISMNLALLNGFFNHLRGIKTNVWKPTER